MSKALPKRAFTLVEMLVSIAIIGILVALLMPAVQQARESSRRASCLNNMKQFALATHMHHDAHQIFPAGRYEPNPKDTLNQCGGREPTWLARVMPYLEQEAMADQWDLSEKWYLHPQAVRDRLPNIFYCPSRRGGSGDLLTSTRLITETEIYLDFGTMNSSAAQSGTQNSPTAQRLPCGCTPVPLPPLKPTGPTDPNDPTDPTTSEEYIEATGALSDYAGNHGDLTPGATGADTDFYFGGNGTGVIISVRPKCIDGRPSAPADRIRMASVRDGQSNTFMFGEKHVPYDRLGQFPEDSPAMDGDHIPASCRIAGPGLRLAHSPRDPLADFLSFGSWHPGVSNFAMVDGSVRSMSVETDTRVLGALANRSDSRVVELESD